MKVLVVLCAVVAGGLSQHSLGYGYSALSPLTGYTSEFAPFSYAYSAPIISHLTPYTAGLPLPTKSQYHSQNELGMASYGHDEPGQSHHAIQDAEGNKYGSFSYVDHFGGVHMTRYSADALGYRVESNDAPIGPAAPLLHRRRRQAPQAPQQWNSPPPSWQNQAAQQPSWSTQTQPQTYVNDAPATREQTWSPGNTQAASLQPYNPAAAAPAVQFTSQPQSAQASRAFFQPQSAPQSWQGQQAQSWQGPQVQPAVTRVNADGTLQDTPEVAEAKQLHAKEFARAASAAATATPQSGMANTQYEDDGSYKPELYNQGSEGRSWNSEPAPAQPTWSGQNWNQQQTAAPQQWSQASERGAYQPQAQEMSSWSQQTPAQTAPQATPYSWNQQQPAQSQSWNQPAADQSWQQQPAATQAWNQQPAPATRTWEQPAAPQSWQQPQATQQWQQPQSQTRSWEGQQTGAYNPQSENAVQYTPDVAAARQAHFQALADANNSQRS